MNEYLKFGIFGLYSIVIIIFVALIIWAQMKKEEKLRRMQSDLKDKITKNFKLSPQDITLLGRAHGLSPISSRLALYRVYKDIDDSESFEKLKILVREIQKEEPFDTMPDEIKPSLSRISELTSSSDNESDRHLLTPITNIMVKYLDLVEVQRRTKKQAYIAYILTIVSFVIGVVSLYFAIKTPSAAEIAQQLKQMGP